MSIRFAILGLLDEQPMHGYRLKDAFDRRMSPLWGLTTGQVYQSLGALERAALVESRGERKGRRPARRVYSITPAGKRELAEWLATQPTAWHRPFREDILIRLMMLRETNATDVWRFVRHQAHEARTLLLHVTRAYRERCVSAPALDLGRIFLDGMIRQLETDLANLERFRDEIEAWAGERGIVLAERAISAPEPTHGFRTEIEILGVSRDAVASQFA
jgi:DNA-binding PadR family transcriptional regulator